MPKLYVALMHYPVVNKNGETIASALTNLDLHDMSRAAKTYGLKALFVVTPLEDQKKLVKRIIAHWTEGVGAEYNPQRRSALELIRVQDSFEEILGRIAAAEGQAPLTVATSARKYKTSLGFEDFRAMLGNGRPYVLIFGTAWGLAEDFISSTDYVLEPIAGKAGYNHLSVRSAAAIIFDRLLGQEMFH